ncbi:MAG: cupin domain-containing protein [Bacillota bacterium]
MIHIRNYREVEARMEVEGVTMRVAIGPDEGAPFFNMRVFEVEPGHATPYHSHWWEHEVFVLSGEGVAVSEQGEREIGPGDTILVPGDAMHRFRNTGDQVLRFICLVPQEWLETLRRPQD